MSDRDDGIPLLAEHRRAIRSVLRIVVAVVLLTFLVSVGLMSCTLDPRAACEANGSRGAAPLLWQKCPTHDEM